MKLVSMALSFARKPQDTSQEAAIFLETLPSALAMKAMTSPGRKMPQGLAKNWLLFLTVLHKFFFSFAISLLNDLQL
jgi:hypothetical protein